jgi:hypothetical protein
MAAQMAQSASGPNWVRSTSEAGSLSGEVV